MADIMRPVPFEELLERITGELRNQGSIFNIKKEMFFSDDEKKAACRAAADAGADFVKTSTGFSTGGATVHDVALMKEAVSARGLKVKASGGIRNYKDAKAMIDAGADRIGASAGIAIVKEENAEA